MSGPTALPNKGAAYQIDYSIVVSVRREQKTHSRGVMGPWLTLLQPEITTEQEQLSSPAKSLQLYGRDSLLALRAAIDEALVQEVES